MTINDPRFNYNDPRFIKPKKNKKKEQEKDNRFTQKADSSNKTKKGTPTLIDYARGRVILESSDDDQEEEEEEEKQQEEESDDEDVELGPSGPKRAQEINLDEEEEVAEAETQHINPTPRIAIVNLDWDNLKPLDIYKVFSSLLVPPHQTPLTTADSKPTPEHKTIQGAVKRVCFYKSEFGKRRMAEEDVQGPPREIFNNINKKVVSNDDVEDENEDLDNEDQGAEFDELALRKYQLDRLRYFYAIVELDSAQSAQHIFSEIDGTEFERTANIFDLSYVPDDMNFDEADLWDECTQDSNDYKGVDFSTDVLRHSKVKLTWDSEDPVRRKYTRLNTQKLTQEELDELDFKAFIASGSSGPESSDSEEEKGGSGRHDGGRLRTLLGLSEDARGQESMEGQEELDITFKPGFVDLPSPAPATVEEPVATRPKKSRNQRTKDKLKKGPLDPLGSHDEQEGETGASTRRDKQAELELLMMDDLNSSGPTDAAHSQNPRHFDLTQILKQEKLGIGTKKNKSKKKRKSQDTSLGSDDNSHQKQGDDLVDQFAMDQDDRRFAPALVHDPEFAIDPSNPHFKKTKNMIALLSTTRAKRASTHSTTTPTGGATMTHSSIPVGSSLLPNSTAQLLRHLKQSPTDTRAKRVRIK